MLSFLRRFFGLSDDRTSTTGPPPELRPPPRATAALSPADVVLDVVCEDGLLFLVLANLGGEPALDVRVTLQRPSGRPFTGLAGELDLNELPLFQRLAMLRGGKELRVFVDTATAWFQREESGEFTAHLTWKQRSGRESHADYAHDMNAFLTGVDRVGR